MKTIILNEWRQLRADRMAMASGGLFLLFLLLGLANGARHVDRQRDTLSAVAAEESERFAKLKAQLVRIETGQAKAAGFVDPRGGVAIGNTSGVRYITMPPAPLGALAVGLGDLHPYFYKLSLRSKSFALNNEELENPLNLLSGSLDLAFGMVLLFPLFLIALNYNLLSAEREQGTLPMFLSQPVGLAKLVAGKILVRGGLVFLMAFLAIVGGAITLSPSPAAELMPRILAWLAVVSLYGLFWLALCIWVNAWGRSSAANAIVLAGCWLGFCLIIPSALNIGATALYPVPSRVEMIQAIRSAGKEAQEKGGQLLSRYLEDHPEMAPPPPPAPATPPTMATTAKAAPGAPPAPPARPAPPDFGSITYAVQIEVDKRTEPVLARFEQAIGRQQGLVDQVRYLSPAILAQVALNEFSGTGLSRYRNFQGQAEAFHQAWQDYFFPVIFQRTKLVSTQVDALPRFVYREESLGELGSRSLSMLAALALIMGVTLWLAFRSLRRFEPTR